MQLPSSSDTFTSLVDSLGPSIVRIQGSQRGGVSGLLWSSDGLVVTAAHALGSKPTAQIAFGDERTGTATVVGRDSTTDLAVLQLEDPSLAAGIAPAEWRPADELRVGDLALALARPGRTVRAALSMVAVVGDGVQTRNGRSIAPYVELDRVLPRGFSLAPVVDLHGQVLGLASASLQADTTVVLGHSVVAATVQALVEHGRIPQGFLGVGVSLARVEEGRALAVIGLAKDGPAAQAGVLVGDVIVAIDGNRVRSASGLRATLADRAGQEVALRLLRAGETTELQLTAGERP